MAFSDLPWPTRMAMMGEEAETKFEETHDDWVRMGFNLPPWGAAFATLPLALRNIPDYMQIDRFVECQGIGRNGLKVKIEKLTALAFWQTLLPVHLFIWSRDREQWCTIPVDELMRIAGSEKASLGAYWEGRKPYLRFTPSVLPWQ